ncbi:MAG: nucleotidyl transferase AbiEii/AbiGii toxin family protein [Euryarchaeota archaeon]|nr:nucleotidyl transferase AbiEii/AbiGii toxin family protein [Euryarchaeota archaeon]
MLDKSGFDSRLIEKIYRISDILQKLYTTEYTKKRLSLYGGTALNFLHFKDIPRLSIDIDFNYRNQQQNDWALERNEIDSIIKKILHDLHYDNDAIAIQVSYPLTRFDVGYKNKKGGKDSLKIEIGYLRRIPILSDDILLPFTHLKTGDEFPVQTPQREELFGNKFCTFLYRYGLENTGSSRDLFDTYTISKMKLNTTLFDVTMVIDSLMRKEPRLYHRNPDNIIKNVMIDDQLKNLIQNKYVPADIKEKTQVFITKHLNNSKDKYKTFIDTFFDHHRFEPNLLEHHDILNQHITDHPSILWNLKQLIEKKKR